LLQNAFKFTHPGSEVLLKVYSMADRIFIEVEDKCGGLPPGDAEKIFLPFTQSGANRSGLGLGLSISRRSVEANDGTLRVRDIPGSGCVFTIDLPRHVMPGQKS
jgi:signal transduction histidine kinase